MNILDFGAVGGRKDPLYKKLSQGGRGGEGRGRYAAGCAGAAL